MLTTLLLAANRTSVHTHTDMLKQTNIFLLASGPHADSRGFLYSVFLKSSCYCVNMLDHFYQIPSQKQIMKLVQNI